MKSLKLRNGLYYESKVNKQDKGDIGQFILDWLVAKGILETTDCCNYTVVGSGLGEPLFTINAGTTSTSTDNSLGEEQVNKGDILHFWSPDGTLDFNITPGSVVTGSKLAQQGASNGQVLTWNGSQYSPQTIPAQPTNLQLGTITATDIELESDTGADVIIPSATTSNAGLLSASDKKAIDAIGIIPGQSELDTFQKGIIGSDSTVKEALQDLETMVFEALDTNLPIKIIDEDKALQEEGRIIAALDLNLDSTRSTAVRKFIRQMRNAGLWDKMFHIYPFLGTTQATQEINILHTDTTDVNKISNKMVFINTPSYSNNGVSFTTTTQYGEIAGEPPAFKSFGISLFSKDDIGTLAGGKPIVSMKPDNSTTQGNLGISLGLSSTAITGRVHSTSYSTFNTTVGAGFYSLQGIEGNQIQAFKNGSLVSTQTQAVMYYPSQNQGNNSNSIQFNSGVNNAGGTIVASYQFFAVHQALTVPEMTLFSNIVRAFQTELGRNGLDAPQTYTRAVTPNIGEAATRIQSTPLPDPTPMVARDGAMGLYFPKTKTLRVYGGWRGSGFLPNPNVNEIIRSDDFGNSWFVEAASSTWTPRHAFCLATSDSDNSSIYLFGGDFQNLGTGDCYKSTDGITFTQQTNTAPFNGTQLGAGVYFKGALYYIGGIGTGPANSPNLDVPNNKVWRSYDEGITWTEITSTLPNIGQCNNQAVVFKDKIWVVGGTIYGSQDPPTSNKVFGRKVWSSPDGIAWTEEFQFPYGFSYASLKVWDGEMWLTNGASPNLSGDGGFNGSEMWRSCDGSTWNAVYIASNNGFIDTHAACVIPVDNVGLFVPFYNLGETSWVYTKRNFNTMANGSNPTVSITTSLPLSGNGTSGSPITLPSSSVGGGTQLLSNVIQLGGSNIISSPVIGVPTGQNLSFQSAFTAGVPNLIIDGTTGRTRTYDFFTASAGNFTVTIGGALSGATGAGSGHPQVGFNFNLKDGTHIGGGYAGRFKMESDSFKYSQTTASGSGGSAATLVDLISITTAPINTNRRFFFNTGGGNGEVFEFGGNIRVGLSALTRSTPLIVFSNTRGNSSIYQDDNPNGNVTANPGSLCMGPSVPDIYIKKTGTGNTGWESIMTGTVLGNLPVFANATSAGANTAATVTVGQPFLWRPGGATDGDILMIKR